MTLLFEPDKSKQSMIEVIAATTVEERTTRIKVALPEESCVRSRL
jgi:hypothetical protein